MSQGLIRKITIGLAAVGPGLFLIGYNIGTGSGTSVNFLFGELAMLTEWQGRPEHAEPRLGDIHKVSLDAALAERDLGWAPSVEFGAGLVKTVDYFRN